MNVSISALFQYRRVQPGLRSSQEAMAPLSALAGNQELADFEATIFEGRGHFLMQEAAEELTGSIIDHALEILATEPARDG